MGILLCAAALLLRICVLFTITALKSHQARKLTQGSRSYSQEELLSYAQALQKMIRCRTVSVKGSFDDTEFAWLREIMAEQFPLVHQKAEIRIFSDDCWIYKIKGRDETRNIMLMSHHDVVSAEGNWEHDGFSGDIADGKLWGRGTVDTKTPLFAEFTALEQLLAQGYVPPCNVYIGSSHNEELGGDGIPEANRFFKEQGISFEVILEEGGAVIDPPLGGMKCEKCAMVAVHEKGRYYLNCTAEADLGHASLTAATKMTPVERMAAFIHEVTNSNLFIRRLNPQVKAMFTHLAPYCGFPMNVLFSNLWLFGGLLQKVMPKLNAQAGGMIGTTCTFNRIDGGTESKNCTARAFLRPVDENDLKTDLDAFRKAAEKYGISVEVEGSSEYHGPADMEKPQFAYTMDCIAKCFPQYPAAPFILPAGTDARILTDVCGCVLRFAPIRLSAQQLASVHGENENINLEAIGEAVDFYKYFLENYR